jgi:hypothetical protein
MAYRSMQLKVLNRICVFFALVLLASHVEAKVTKSVFGSMPDGTKVEIFTLEEGSLKAQWQDLRYRSRL